MRKRNSVGVRPQTQMASNDTRPIISRQDEHPYDVKKSQETGLAHVES